MRRRFALFVGLPGTVVGLVVLLSIIVLSAGDTARAGSGDIYTVDTTSDAFLNGCVFATADDCSLRGAISKANALGSNGDIIRFDLAVFPPNAPATISISSTVGQMTGGLDTIDATTAGVIIDGSATEDRSLNCLIVVSDGNTVQGLQITDCSVAINVETVADNNHINSNIVYDNLVGLSLRGNSNQANGNLVGTNAAGTAVHPDGGNYQGIAITGDGNQVGGVSPNVISGNDYSGVEIQTAGSTTVAGNYIGTDITGTSAITNPTGIGVQASSTNTVIGGASAASRNVISGNNVGIAMGGGSTGSAVLGNYVGTNAAGTGALSNLVGVSIQNSAGNCIGGTFQVAVCTTGAGTRNVISGNSAIGVQITQPGSTNNSVRGNYIGVAADGVSPLGNGTYGIFIDASNNGIGYLNPGDGNRIAYNTNNGVKVSGGTGNSIFSNEIFSNQLLGIDIGIFAGVTANDPGDADTGANDLQNFPVLTSATTTSVQGTLNSTPNTQFFIQFFDSESCDPSGFGEGEHLAGSGGGTTDPSGTLSFNVTTSPVAAGRYITAVATPDAPPLNSSEFSACMQVQGTTQTPTTSPSPTATETTTATATATATPTGTASGSPTVTASGSPSVTSTPTATPTGSPGTGSPTPTQTPTPTPTVTASPTIGPSPSPCQTVEECIEHKWGDHNCSGSADPVDALLNLRHDAGLPTETNLCPEMGATVDVDGTDRTWGDFDCSGTADPVDGLKVLRFDAGLDVARAAGCPDPGETVTIS